jgi:hypothetical protein
VQKDDKEIRERAEDCPNFNSVAKYLRDVAECVQVVSGKRRAPEKRVIFALARHFAKPDADGRVLLSSLERKKKGGIVWFCEFRPEIVDEPLAAVARLAAELLSKEDAPAPAAELPRLSDGLEFGSEWS